jgi:hypothetical protein
MYSVAPGSENTREARIERKKKGLLIAYDATIANCPRQQRRGPQLPKHDASGKPLYRFWRKR